MDFGISVDSLIVSLVIGGIFICVVVIVQLVGVTRTLRQNSVKSMMQTDEALGSRASRSGRNVVELKELEVEHIKRITKYARATSASDRRSIEQRLFQAGFYAPKFRKYFLLFQLLALTSGALIAAAAIFYFGNDPIFLSISFFVGLVIGAYLPFGWLNRRVEAREEEIRYFLPLVIEQVSIGVSSALIVGTSITKIIETADKRDAHNPVTELFVHADKLVRSGMNLDDALMEVAEVCGMSEVQHAFMFLVQCSRHGGEVTKQLQGLADSIMMERNVQVQARIAALPVKATGPLGMVFAGFFALLMSGLVVRVGSALMHSGIGGS